MSKSVIKVDATKRTSRLIAREIADLAVTNKLDGNCLDDNLLELVDEYFVAVLHEAKEAAK